MGLRLYQPPVESDIKSKPSADKIFSRARSLIGRSRVSVSSEQQRERRRRILAAGLDSRRRSPPLDASTGPPAPSDTTGQTDNTENGRHVLRDMASRMGVLDERVVAMFGERWAHLHAESNSPLRDDDDDNDSYEFYIPAPPSMMAVEPEFLERRRPRLPTEPYTVSSIRSTQAPTRSSRSPARSSLGAHVRRAVRDRNTPRHSVGADIAAYRAELLSRPRRRREESQLSPEHAQVDGLGDRNRSLSPEGDGIWDTMLTTLTPDPHPPSIGSSFASTAGSASAAASQSAATRSSATSFAGPDTIEESALEQPCDSGCESSDTEALEGEEAEQNVLSRFGLRNDQPTYADVVSSTRSSSFDDTLDSIGDVRGMQRIVRRLANRDDIPDEWWAQVGLSRTLSREASTNERD